MTNKTDKNRKVIREGSQPKIEQTPSDTNPQGQSPSPIPAALESPIVFTYSRKDALADGRAS